MATSPVSICNIALGWLGETPITSLDDPSQSAQLCKINYEPLRDTVLEDRAWTFAIERIDPVRLVKEPVYGFDAAFQIPPDVIRVLQVSRASDVGTGGIGGSYGTPRGDTGQGRESRIQWNREGDKIVCNGATAIFARVIKRVKDTSKFSPAFVQALAARIAMDLALPITQSKVMADKMEALYGAKINIAGASDGSQGRSERTRSNSLTIVR